MAPAHASRGGGGSAERVWSGSVHIGPVPARLVETNHTLMLLRTWSFRLLIWEEKAISQVLNA